MTADRASLPKTGSAGFGRTRFTLIKSFRANIGQRRANSGRNRPNSGVWAISAELSPKKSPATPYVGTNDPDATKFAPSWGEIAQLWSKSTRSKSPQGSVFPATSGPNSVEITPDLVEVWPCRVELGQTPRVRAWRRGASTSNLGESQDAEASRDAKERNAHAQRPVAALAKLWADAEQLCGFFDRLSVWSVFGQPTNLGPARLPRVDQCSMASAHSGSS